PMSEATHELDAIEAALGRRAIERELDEREGEWEAVARGELELEEAIERRRAAGDDQATIERAAAYFRPLDEGEPESLVEALLGSIGNPDESEPESESESGSEAEVVPLHRPEPEPQAHKH